MNTKLTDINDDCIETILKLLDFDVLLNVAESDAKLRDVASSVILRRYGRQKFRLVIKCSANNKPKVYKGYTLNDGEVIGFDLRSVLRILRCFGSVCSQISIDYQKMSLIQKKKIESHLGKYCAHRKAALTDIVLKSCGKSALRFIEKPLRSITHVTVSDTSNLDFERLNRKFPNMSSLKFDWAQIKDGKCIERKFPALKQLEIDIGDRSDYFTQENVQNTLKKNPQINHLIVGIYPHPELNVIQFRHFLENNFEASGRVLRVIQ